MLSIIVSIVALIANWRIFQKMGREGWEGIVPFYNTYVLCQELYGNGWKFLLFLIPLYNIYFAFKLNIDLAHKFNKGTGFGIGLVLLSTIFLCILAFDSSTYGTIAEPFAANDPLNNVIDKVSAAASAPRKDPNALNKLKELSALHANGVLTDEEFQQKKAELLKKI